MMKNAHHYVVEFRVDKNNYHRHDAMCGIFVQILDDCSVVHPRRDKGWVIAVINSIAKQWENIWMM